MKVFGWDHIDRITLVNNAGVVTQRVGKITTTALSLGSETKVFTITYARARQEDVILVSRSDVVTPGPTVAQIQARMANGSFTIQLTSNGLTGVSGVLEFSYLIVPNSGR